MIALYRLRKSLSWLAFLFLAACVSGGNAVVHSFSFDTLFDDQDAEILEYRYGTSTLPVSASASSVREGQALTFNNVSGPMAKGDSLYVKWRIKSTGQVHEDTADLRQRLPADITDHRIHFIVRGARLFVYLVTPNRRRSEDPPNGPGMYRHLKVITLYPDTPETK